MWQGKTDFNRPSDQRHRPELSRRICYVQRVFQLSRSSHERDPLTAAAEQAVARSVRPAEPPADRSIDVENVADGARFTLRRLRAMGGPVSGRSLRRFRQAPIGD